MSRFEDDDTVKPVITKALSGLSLQLSNMSMNDNYKPYINVRQKLPTHSLLNSLCIGTEIDVTISPNCNGNC